MAEKFTDEYMIRMSWQKSGTWMPLELFRLSLLIRKLQVLEQLDGAKTDNLGELPVNRVN